MAKKTAFYIFLIAVIAASLLVGAKFGSQIPLLKKGGSTQRWSAVTLDNGLIYFGELKGGDRQYVVLREAYFAQQNPNWVKPEDREKGKEYKEPQYLLTKVGDTEVYGPDSTMRINRDHILIVQDLKPDSQVIKTIKAR